MKQRKVLVTGGAGFLGSHLCEKLLKQNYFVFCVDNFFTGKKENISFFEHYKGQYECIEHDICHPLDLEVDEIYNLASPASPHYYQLDPIQTLKTNVLGSINMLEIAAKKKIRILQASTSEVYGDPQLHPQNEEYWGNVNPVGVRSCYDEGKRCAETLFFDYWRQKKIPIKVVRIFNTYGPRMQPDDGRVISNFIVQALKNQPLTVYGNGEQTRSFCYVEDLIEGLIRMMHSHNVITGPINLGNPMEYKIIDLAEKIIALTGSKSPIVSHPLPSDDPQRRKPNISKAEDFLKWSPITALHDGLIATIEYFDQILSLEEESTCS